MDSKVDGQLHDALDTTTQRTNARPSKSSRLSTNPGTRITVFDVLIWEPTLRWRNVARLVCRVRTLIAGPDAMLTGIDGTLDGLVAETLIAVPAVSIARARARNQNPRTRLSGAHHRGHW